MKVDKQQIRRELLALEKTLQAIEEIDEKVVQERIIRAAANLLGIDILRPVVIQK